MKKEEYLEIRRLVDKSFVPLAQQTGVLYCRLTDLWLQKVLVFYWKSFVKIKSMLNFSLSFIMGLYSK